MGVVHVVMSGFLGNILYIKGFDLELNNLWFCRSSCQYNGLKCDRYLVMQQWFDFIALLFSYDEFCFQILAFLFGAMLNQTSSHIRW